MQAAHRGRARVQAGTSATGGTGVRPVGRTAGRGGAPPSPDRPVGHPFAAGGPRTRHFERLRRTSRGHTCPMTSPASPWHPGAGSLPVIAPRGDFDYGAVPQLQGQIDSAVNEHGGLILDAGGITFIDTPPSSR